MYSDTSMYLLASLFSSSSIGFSLCSFSFSIWTIISISLIIEFLIDTLAARSGQGWANPEIFLQTLKIRIITFGKYVRTFKYGQLPLENIY